MNIPNRFVLILLKINIILSLVLLLRAPPAGAADYSFGLAPQGLAGVEFVCEAFSFRDEHAVGQPKQEIKGSGHRARFDILRSASGEDLLVNASLIDVIDKHRGNGRAAAGLFQMKPRRLPDLLLARGLGDEQIRALFRAGRENYLEFPARERGRSSGRGQTSSDFGYVTFLGGFPGGMAAHVGLIIPIEVKLTPSSTRLDPGAEYSGSRVYEGLCLSYPLDESSFEYKRQTLLEQAPQWARAGRSLFSAPEPAAVGNSPASLPIYATDGTLLRGQAAPAAAVSAALAFAALRSLRHLVSALTRSPSFAAVLVPPGEGVRLTLDVNALGLGVEEARAFFRAPPESQGRVCETNPRYQSFCQALVRLDYELALAEGRAL